MWDIVFSKLPKATPTLSLRAFSVKSCVEEEWSYFEKLFNIQIYTPPLAGHHPQNPILVRLFWILCACQPGFVAPLASLTHLNRPVTSPRMLLKLSPNYGFGGWKIRWGESLRRASLKRHVSHLGFSKIFKKGAPSSSKGCKLLLQAQGA